MRTGRLLRYALMAVMAVAPLAAGLKLLALLLSAWAAGGVLVLPPWPNVCDAALLAASGLFWLAWTFYRWLKEVRA